MEEALFNYRLHGCVDSVPTVDWSHLDVPCQPQTLQDQLDVLSSLSNYHWETKHRASGDKRHHVGYLQTLSARDETSKHLPYSPRNRLIYFIVEDDGERLVELLQSIQQTHSHTETHDAAACDEPVPHLPAKRRRYTHRVVQVTAAMLTDQLHLHHAPSADSMATQDSSLFEDFQVALVEQGDIHWRLHSSDKDIILMNAYNPESGSLSPVSFVHVIIIHDEVEPLFLCECPIYKLLQQMVGNNDSEVALVGTTCMHCRFAKEFIVPMEGELFNAPGPNTGPSTVTTLKQKMLQACRSIGSAVIQVGATSPATTLKFSVVGDDGMCALVHLSQNCHIISCQSGACAASMSGKKRAARRLLSLQEDTLCSHLEAMRASSEVWQPYYSEKEAQDDADAEVNTEDTTDDPPVDTLDDHTPQVYTA